MKSAALLSIGLLFLLACNKKPDSSRTDLLTEKPWKFVKIESSMNNGPWYDEVQFWATCEKDDELVFLIDHSYSLRNGETKCDASDPDVFDVATWNFLDNETKLDMDGSVTTIDALDKTQMILSSTETSGVDTYRYRYTLAH